MKPIFLGALVAFAFGSTGFAAEYKLDPGHTEVRFYWDHAGLTEQSGEWGEVNGTIIFDPENVEATSVSLEIPAASVDTGVTGLDDHLKSADFFEAETYPTITFQSTGVKQASANSVVLTGDLTVKDNTKPIELDVELTFQGQHPLGGFFEYYQGEWIAIEATGTLLRSDFGVGKFAPLTSDRIRLEIAAEMRQGGWN